VHHANDNDVDHAGDDDDDGGGGVDNYTDSDHDHHEHDKDNDDSTDILADVDESANDECGSPVVFELDKSVWSWGRQL
jgi:hypothetical protein